MYQILHWFWWLLHIILPLIKCYDSITPQITLSLLALKWRDSEKFQYSFLYRSWFVHNLQTFRSVYSQLIQTGSLNYRWGLDECRMNTLRLLVPETAAHEVLRGQTSAKSWRFSIWRNKRILILTSSKWFSHWRDSPLFGHSHSSAVLNSST